VGWHCHVIEPSAAPSEGFITKVLPSSATFARCGELLEYVTVIWPF